jgi:hypothetical protein
VTGVAALGDHRFNRRPLERRRICARIALSAVGNGCRRIDHGAAELEGLRSRIGAGRSSSISQRRLLRSSSSRWHGTARTDEPALGEHPGHWSDHRHGPGGDGDGADRLCQPPRVRGMARSSAAAALDRRQSRGSAASRGAAISTCALCQSTINGASANLLRSNGTDADPWIKGLRRRQPAWCVPWP